MQTWVVKLSKLCNMRCAYCYEWNELSNPSRMDVELWRRVVQAAIDYNSMQISIGRAQPTSRVLVILHGGEPLALPAAYLREILTVFQKMTREAPGVYSLALQSNLYSVSDEKLNVLLDHRVNISFSYDVVPGVRLNVLGKPTEEAVSKNIERLRSKGVPLNGIVVLARHTVGRITEVYDFYAERRMGMRVLPLFDGPDERPTESFIVDHLTIVASLQRLFRHWMATGCSVPIRPFDLYFQAALRHMGGVAVARVSRRQHGDGVLLINVDGTAYRVIDAYVPELSLGNITLQSLDELLQSEAYAASLVRDSEEYDKHCDGCSYRESCNGRFLYDTRATFPYEGSCVTGWHCISFMVQFIREQGYDDGDIRKLLAIMRRSEQAVSPTIGL